MSRRWRWSAYAVALIGCLAAWAVFRLPPGDEEDIWGAPPKKRPELAGYYQKIDQLAPFFDPLPKPEEDDWLAKYTEAGQTFDEYVAYRRREPIRKTYSEIHLLPLGDFTPSQKKLLVATHDFMERFFEMKVVTLEGLPLDDVPEEAQRTRDNGKRRQLRTTYLLHDVLKPQRSKKAAALLGFVAEDLYPDDDWNYVFGQATLDQRVGVWSLYRNGNSDGAEDEYRLCLLRTLKTAVHETGHMLGIPHCTAYSCCMNGSNHRDEADRKPLEFCPQCQAKLWWTCRADPIPRYQKLKEFSDAAGFAQEVKFWEKLEQALTEK